MTLGLLFCATGPLMGPTGARCRLAHRAALAQQVTQGGPLVRNTQAASGKSQGAGKDTQFGQLPWNRESLTNAFDKMARLIFDSRADLVAFQEQAIARLGPQG